MNSLGAIDHEQLQLELNNAIANNNFDYIHEHKSNPQDRVPIRPMRRESKQQQHQKLSPAPPQPPRVVSPQSSSSNNYNCIPPPSAQRRKSHDGILPNVRYCSSRLRSNMKTAGAT